MTAHWSYLASVNVSNPNERVSVKFYLEFHIVPRHRNRGRHGERERENDHFSMTSYSQTLEIFRFLFIVRNLRTNCTSTHTLNRKTKVLPFIQMVDIIGDDWAPATIYVPNRLTFQVFGTACILTRCRSKFCSAVPSTLIFSHSLCLSISALTTLGDYFVIFISLSFFVRFLNLCCCELNSSSWQTLCIPVLLGGLAGSRVRRTHSKWKNEYVLRWHWKYTQIRADTLAIKSPYDWIKLFLQLMQIEQKKWCCRTS